MDLRDTELKKKILKQTELFVLDMDGTFYLGNDILDGALDFLKAVKDAGKRYIFFTNNSSTSPKLYIDKLAKMNCNITRDMIMTSGDVMIRFLKNKYPGKSVYLLGTPALTESFKEEGINLFVPERDLSAAQSNAFCEKIPDIVVVAFDKTLDYEKLSNACVYIMQGAMFLATHLDINCPVPGGFIPDCGAMCAAIELSTKVKPKFVGKPFAETVDMVVDATGVDKDKISFVGDRIYTDVATGVNNGALGVLVLTGETKLSEVPESEVQPHVIFDSIKEMGELLNEL
ncbi:HAD-IIA family hydrolase [Butyrivibrio sp. CB08]|uniref:HAD-IIA family hydrolase n=1 Tax=Butyrivibrio sp. CB08 TaxID=2364879 RepID=UPI000EAA3A63|nr:HAD-IIA family hydrolase [Butyrivibrio sp. CB08]RKM57587.1 HAD-IIA family hydrolase [Butyrivibrio sp. CB08]